MRQFYKNKEGFTLVEVIVVLVILALLAAILIPSLTGWIDEANAKVCVTHRGSIMRQFRALQTLFYGEEKPAASLQNFLDHTGEEAAYTKDIEGLDCPNKGTYTAGANDGSIICSIHGAMDGTGRPSGLGTVNDPYKVLDQARQNSNTNFATRVDSTAPETYDSGVNAGKDTNVKKINDLIQNTLGADNVAAWSIRNNKNGDYYYFWTDQDITAMNTGDTVRVVRYNTATQNYTVGYTTIENRSEDGSGITTKYNCLMTDDATWKSVNGSISGTANYTDAVAKFNATPVSKP